MQMHEEGTESTRSLFGYTELHRAVIRGDAIQVQR